MEKKVQVIFQMETDGEIGIEASIGEKLLDIAKRGNIAIDAPCAGSGTCGKCRVKLLSGQLDSEPGKHLSEADFQNGWRLACVSAILSEVTVSVPASALAYQNQIRVMDLKGRGGEDVFAAFEKDLEPLGFGPSNPFVSVQIGLTPPELEDPCADRERLLGAIGEAVAGLEDGADYPPVVLSMTALRKLPEVLREGDFTAWYLLRRDEDKTLVMDVSVDKPRPLGLAVDIGTTTVSAILTDLSDGKLLAAGSAGNGQIRYGGDVIHRLIESARPGGMARLRSAVTEACIRPLVMRLCVEAGAAQSDICLASIAGNTTMAHLFTGVYANHLRMEPYVPAFFQLEGFTGMEAEIGIHHDAEVRIAPAVGSYVGGDITAGVFASGIHRKETISLFIDLGTNGELVLGSSDFLMTCACSAGPAFEGGEIRCGMRATDGAIEACVLDEATMEPSLTIIGGERQKAVGICGSGLIDIIGELFRCGVINAKGKFIREGDRITTDEWGITKYKILDASDTMEGKEIFINDADIDNFIRAKGSIFSAIRTLMQMTDMEPDMIEEVCVAGGIGSGINIENAIRIGMFPDIGVERYRYIGNTSLLGAYGMVTSAAASEDVDGIAAGMTYIELSTWPTYMDEFIAACFLPHTDASLFSA